MKKRIMICAIALLMLCLAGCGSNTSSLTDNTESHSSAIVETNSPEVSLAPQQFSNEEEFVKALKDGKVYGEYHPEEIRNYYRPKVLPEGAILLYVEVNYDYVILMYTLDKEHSDDLTKQIMYKTIRGYTTEDYIQFCLDSGETEYDLEGKTSDSRYFAFDSYDAVKSGYEEYGYQENDLFSPYAWTMHFVQSGDCFSGNVPFSMDAKDITKYFDMEKVMIE